MSNGRAVLIGGPAHLTELQDVAGTWIEVPIFHGPSPMFRKIDDPPRDPSIARYHLVLIEGPGLEGLEGRRIYLWVRP